MSLGISDINIGYRRRIYAGIRGLRGVFFLVASFFVYRISHRKEKAGT